MAKGKDKRPVYLVRKGLSLVPTMEMDAETIQALPEDQPIRIEIRNSRFLPRLQAYWAMLHECVKATGCAPNAEILHEGVKLNTGHVEFVRTSNGLTYAVPGSIAFNEMKDEAAMVTFFESAKEYLAREHGFVGDT